MTHGESARRCVLIPSGTFKLIIEAGKTRPHNGGWAGSLLFVTADREHPASSVACITSTTKSSSQTATVTFSTTPAALRLEVKWK